MKDMKNVKTVKIVVCGDGAVGKTTLIKRITNKYQESDRNTIKMTPGIDIDTLIIPEHEDVVGAIWDLGGQTQFRFIQEAFFRGADIVILLYSVEWYHSFADLSSDWIKLISPLVPPKKIFLVANKIDSPNKVLLTEDGLEFAEKINANFYEVSAITGANVDEFRKDLIESVVHIGKSLLPIKKNHISPELIENSFEV